ncbi:MAG: peptidylprolyl isomerase [Solirubrobacteraceae bacterium]|nr:peptidylprolyl isomerase [Solirubrobacteraceae bacterium]
MRRRTASAALLAAAALGLGACGDSNKTVVESSPLPDPYAAEKPAPAGPSIQKLQISTDLTKKPAVARPSGDPPKKLYSRDIVTGKGKAAKLNDSVSVNYVGNSYSTGTEFDSSWSRGEPTTFQLKKGGLIEGWIEGIPGMRVGGRRLLVIPPDLAYKDQQNGSIAPNETLVFVIDLKKVGA